MKKGFALGLAIMMAASLMTTPVLAADSAAEDMGNSAENPIPLTYEMIDPDVYEGEWVDTELGYDMYLPTAWSVLEVSEEDAKDNIVFEAADEETGANILVSANEVDETYTYDDLATELADSDTDLTYCTLNDIPAIMWETAKDKQAGYAILLPNHYVVFAVLTSAATDDAGYDKDEDMFLNIIMSVSLTEDADSSTDSAA